MPQTKVSIYAEHDGTCPLLDWLDGLPKKVQNKCLVKIERLAELGHEIRRPEADYLRDGIYELRTAFQSVQYRMLYFFHDKEVVISHGILKKGREVKPGEIDLAIIRKGHFRTNPMKHTYRG